jgi:uncharacterized protein YkwD
MLRAGGGLPDPRNMFIRRHPAALLALTAAAVICLAPAASARAHYTCRYASTPATAATRSQMRAAVVCLINQQRTKRHLPALHPRRSLDRSAQRWTNAMVASRRFTHGGNFAARITAAGFNSSAAGENIATGFATPHDVVRAWMASTGHCRNILDPTFADVGTGISPHPVGHSPAAPATWTQDFALRSGHKPPSDNHRPASGCPYHI